MNPGLAHTGAHGRNSDATRVCPGAGQPRVRGESPLVARVKSAGLGDAAPVGAGRGQVEGMPTSPTCRSCQPFKCQEELAGPFPVASVTAG